MPMKTNTRCLFFSLLSPFLSNSTSHRTDQEIRMFTHAPAKDQSEPSSPRLSSAASEQMRLEKEKRGR